MIIVPIEKRFDWKHPPWALALLVLVNVAVFAFYQSRDGRIWARVGEDYWQSGHFEAEWPKFQAFLDETDPSARAAADEDFERYAFWGVFYAMLTRDDFDAYLQERWAEELTAALGATWHDERRALRERLDTLSERALGLIPAELRPLTLITSQFLHADLNHLLGNMLFLVLCGFAVEAAIGHGRFLGFYLLSGVFAGLTHALLDMDSMLPTIGASGAVSGVMAMYVAIFRLRRIEFFYWVFVFVGYVRLPALAVLPLYIAKECFDLIMSPDAGIAFAAHAGGFLAGAALIGLLFAHRPHEVDESYLLHDQDADPFREALDRVYRAIGAHRFAHALKLVEAMIEEHGARLDLRLLERQLLEVIDPDACRAATARLLAQADLTTPQITAQLKLLQRDPMVVHDLDDQALEALAARLCRIGEFDAAEALVKSLVDREARGHGLAVLARRLAEAFKAGHRPDKADHYAALARKIG